MKQSINIKGTLVDLSSPKIMGILNCTPDSFFDGGKNYDSKAAISSGIQMVREGASFIDIGGYSSRPGAKDVSVQEELNRVLPVIEGLNKEVDTFISIDTFRSEIASAAIQAGAHVVNDISAGDQDKNMIPTVAGLKVPYIAMHKQGVSATMQDNPQYDDVVLEVLAYLLKKKEECFKAGIVDLIIDPGFGFGKTVKHNFDLLANLTMFENLELPILTGVSRKSMIYKTTGTTSKEALNGTSFLHGYCLEGGAKILRVHDVIEAKQCVDLWHQLHPES